jgi:hypothetical protein
LPIVHSECEREGVRRITIWFVGAACLLGFGCKASVNADARAGLSGDGAGEAPTSEPLAAGDAEEDAPEMLSGAPPALLGARHDLRLAANQTTPRCSCLAVAAGAPSDPAFQWRAGAPTVDSGTQLVVALGSEGIDCPAAPADSLGASYWGHRQRGADVEVVVETARAGRPLTHGAIIPKPTGSGQVLIVPLDGSVPYGRGLDGAATCRINGQVIAR